MHCPRKVAAPRRRRIAALVGLAGLLTYGAADAQSDKDWLETALEKTQRLSSPWELPLGPEFDSAVLPNAFVIGPDSSTESALVPEGPWGGDLPEKTGTHLEIRLVDDFEDPWSGRSVVEGTSVPSRNSLNVAQGAEDLDSVDLNASAASDRYAGDPELIDPWAD